MFDDLLLKLRSKEPTGRERLEELCGPHWGQSYKGEMKNDKGERTNRKIKDQPFYHRGAKGKMRGW